MEVRHFDKSTERLIKSVQKQTAIKIFRVIYFLEEFGSELGMPYSKKLGDNLFELRVKGKQEVRIFYTHHQSVAVLLGGFVKKTNKTPRKEIDKALIKLKILD